MIQDVRTNELGEDCQQHRSDDIAGSDSKEAVPTSFGPLSESIP